MPHPVLTARQESHPLTSVFWYMVPDSESKISFIILILISFIWFDEKCTLSCTLGPFWWFL